MCIRQYFRQITLGIGIAVIAAVANPTEAQDEILTSGSLYAWGDGIDGMHYLPPGNNFVTVTGGTNHHIALRTDGTIAAWGDNTHGQLNVPSSPFSAISSNGNYNLALKEDSTIAAWGEDRDGVVSDIPTGGGYVAISAGRFHAMALNLDGSIVSWGNDLYGQVSNTFNPADSPTTEGEAVPFVTAIAAGGYHSLALLSDGSIKAWGRDSEYFLVSGTPPGKFKAIAASTLNNLALSENGTIFGWGHPQILAGIPDEAGFKAISRPGTYRAVALSSNDSIVQWLEAADPAMVGNDFIAIHEGNAPIGIATVNPFDISRPVDPTGRWQPVAEGLRDKTTNLIWGFGASEVNFYLRGESNQFTWQDAQPLPILDRGINTTYPAFSNQFFTRTDTNWRLPTIEEMRAADVAGLIEYLDASPRPGFQRLGFVGTSDPTYQCTCCSSTNLRKDSGWWLNFETGESFAQTGNFFNYIAVRPASTDGGGGTGGGKPGGGKK